MRLGWSDIRLVELDRRVCESALSVAALALQAFLRAVAGANLFGVIVGTAVVYRKRIMRTAGRMTTPSFGAGTAMLGGAALATVTALASRATMAA